MLDLRILRAAALPVLLALIVVAFSLENRPEPLRTTFAPDAFQPARVTADASRLAAAHPARRPGSPGDAALAAAVRGRLRSLLPGVRVTRRVVHGETVDGDRDLVTVTAQRPGSGPAGQIVLVAARDLLGRGGRAQMTATATLLELARVLAQASPRRTVTFASVSGSTGGQAGMRDLVAHLPRPVDAVIEIGDIGGPATGALTIVPWSNGSGAASGVLARTFALALREEADTEGGAPRARAQLARFAFPVSLSGQGVALQDGVAALRLSVSGERAPRPSAPVDPDRVQRVGRGLLRAVTALDEGPGVGGAASGDLVIARKQLPAWSVRLLVGALLLPALMTLGDAVARRRRRGEPLWPGIAYVLSLAAPLLLAWCFVRLEGLLGLVAATAPPGEPGAVPFDGRGAVALVCAVVVLALGYLVLQPPLARRLGAAHDAAHGGVLAPVLVAAACGAVAWILNPYAALVFVAPSLLWLVLPGREDQPRRGPALAAVLLGLLPALVLAQSVASQLGVGLTDVPWYALTTLAGGQLGVAVAAGWSLAGGAAVAAVFAALRAGRGGPHRAVTVRGPVSYAGPGSLGGTSSARRR